MDLAARLLPYLRLREVNVLARSCKRLEGIAAARHHVVLGLWARLEEAICLLLSVLAPPRSCRVVLI